MRPDFVIVLTPFLHCQPGVVKAHESVRVQAFRSKLAIEGFDKCIVGWLAGSREVKHDIPLIGPEIEMINPES